MEDVDDILAALAYVDFTRNNSHTCSTPHGLSSSSSGQTWGDHGPAGAGLMTRRHSVGTHAPPADLLQAASTSSLATSPDEGTFFHMSPESSFSGLRIEVPADDPGEEEGKRLADGGPRSTLPMSNLYCIIEPLQRLLTGPEASSLRDPEMIRYASVTEALEHAASGSLAFDSNQLKYLTNGRPLSTLAMFLFRTDGIFAKLGLDEVKAQSFFESVEDNMHSHPYHNCVHVSDVLQALYANTLEGGGLYSLCGDQPLLLLAVLLAAVIHDVDHPGTNNDFLIKSGHPIALQYEDNDEGSPLELHHIHTGLRLLRREENNFLEPLNTQEWELVWAIVREMVLNTDMKLHMPFLEKAKNGMRSRSSEVLGEDEEEDPDIITEKGLVMAAIKFSMAMKCADLGHCLRPPTLHIKWTQAVTSEFYRQGDWEAKLGLPVTQGMFRPAVETEIYQSQAFFLEHYLWPMFEQWATVSESPRSKGMLLALERNIEKWKQLAGGEEVESANTGAARLLRSVSISREEQWSSVLQQRTSKTQPSTPTGLSSPRFTSSLRSIPATEYLSRLSPSPSEFSQHDQPASPGTSMLLESLATSHLRGLRSRYAKSCVVTGPAGLTPLLKEGLMPQRRHTTSHHLSYSRLAAESTPTERRSLSNS